MPYYDNISSQWHSITGFKGGAFKSWVLNDILLEKIDSIAGRSILEIGAGNGYFFPMIMKRYSGQVPEQIIITDASESQLKVAQKHFRIHGATYMKLDVYKPFPLEDFSTDLIISTMVFNEVKDEGLSNGLRESFRILEDGGTLLMTVLHPDFVEKQIQRGVVKNGKMPGAKGLQIPVISRSMKSYLSSFEAAGFSIESENIYGNEKLFKVKPALKKVKDAPIGLVFTLRK